MQIDWQKGEWQCVRMVVDQLINQVIELAKQLQDARRNYGQALKKSGDKDEVISRLYGRCSDYKRQADVLSIYAETLEADLVESGVTREDLDAVYRQIEMQVDGEDAVDEPC